MALFTFMVKPWVIFSPSRFLIQGSTAGQFSPRMMGHRGVCLFDQHRRTPDFQSNHHVMHELGLV
jgi:hypothetical protein